MTTVSNMPCLERIEESTFAECSSLPSISIPNVREIEDNAFNSCSSLTSVTMPNVNKIGESAFFECKSLRSVSIPNIRTIGREAFTGCKSLTSVSNMPYLEEIGPRAFVSAPLTSISMPNLRRIGGEAFYYCDSLRTLVIDRLIPPEVIYRNGYTSDICYESTYKRANLVVPREAEYAYRNTRPWNRFFLEEGKGEIMRIQTYSDFKIREIPFGDTKRGFTADGVTQLMFTAATLDELAPDSYSISVTMNGLPVTNPRLTGSVGPLFKDEISGYSFILTAPEDYSGPKNSFSYQLEFELKAAGKSYYAVVEVWRPGVLLLHGLNSSDACWRQARDYLLSSGAYSPAQIVNVSYQASNKVSFDDNTYRYNVVGRNVENLYAQLQGAGIASSRYDLVGHSMGGILSRKYAQEVNAGAVNRILTFDTPHSGSSLAILPGKLNISALDEILGRAGVKKLVNAILGPLMALHDLHPSSEAIATLNDPQLMAYAAGIPCHAACSVFDGADDNVEPDFSQTGIDFRYLPVSMALPAWLMRMGEIAAGNLAANLSNRAGLDFLSAILGESRHDGVVALASQRGGLREGGTASVLSAYYDGRLGFGSAAHHCNMPEWTLNHQRMLSLLLARKKDSRFAAAFAPADLSQQMRQEQAAPAQAAPADAFVRLTSSCEGRNVNLHIEHSTHVKACGVMCMLDDERVILADADSAGNAVMHVPDYVGGELEFIAVGRCADGAWVADVKRHTFEPADTMAWLRIENSQPLTIGVGQSLEPQVAVHWHDGSQTPVSATLTLLEADGVASIANGAVTGIAPGTCRLVASFRAMTDTIPVVIISTNDGVGTVMAESSGPVRLFTRGDMLVAQFTGSYEGDADLELYDIEGELTGRASFGGRYEPGDELTLPLPAESGRIYIARCRHRHGASVMKIIR